MPAPERLILWGTARWGLVRWWLRLPHSVPMSIAFGSWT